MLETKLVQVTGRGSNVNLDVDDSAPFDDVLKGLIDHLSANRLMYSRGEITVNVGRRMLNKEELTQIKQTIEKESGVTVSRFWCPPSVLEEALSENIGFGVAVSPKETKPREAPAREEIAHNDPRFWSAPPAEDDGPAGLEKWAAYILDSDESAEKAKPETIEEAEEAPPQEPDPAVEQPEAAHSTEEVGEEEAQPEEPVAVAEEEAEPAAAPEPEPTIETKWQEVARAEAAPVRRAEPRAEPKQEISGLNRGNEALLIKTHCRSGEVIRYAGDVVIMADVNPGSEIIADGDILVFGNLRGFAHAGAGGDIQATIIALNFETHRLQIGPYTGVDPKPKKRSKSNRSNPRIAYVRRRSVYVAPYTGRFGGYSGGTLYDG